MASYFLKFDKYFPCFFIIRSFGDEFRTIFGDIRNEGKTFNSILATLIIVQVTLIVMSVNDFVISRQVYAIIISILFIPAMLFINYKLFLVVRKSRKDKRISPDMKKPTDGACADFVLFRFGPIRYLFSGVEISLY